jgi:hypothetical protein
MNVDQAGASMRTMSSERQRTGRVRAPRARSGAAGEDEARLALMRRVKAMSLEERIALFERLSRDAAWARTARRVR